ncbi:hypothetical protein EYC80_008830 [Monilinia laxa]|uniref:EH domain-containing protein n=1 Tax=Monilinia laxa TaxID=61186 RepID=A0A5N6K1Z1_MONLA|nr:hypothetical protein EYC80_008830 [Monilinia laxa]
MMEMEMDADWHEDGAGDAVVRPVTDGTGANTTHRVRPAHSSSTSTLRSTASLLSTTSPRSINHNSSTTSLRNINTGGTAHDAAIAGAASAFSNSGKANLGKSKAVPPVPNKNRVLLNSGAGVRGSERGDGGASANTYSGKDGALAATAAARARVGGSPGRGNGVVGAAGSAGGRSRSSSKASVMSERMGYGQQMLGEELMEESETMDGGSIGGGSEYQGGQRRVQRRVQHRPNGYLQYPFSSGTSTPESGSNAKISSAAFIAANLAANRSIDVTPNHTGQSQRMGMGMGGGKQASPLPSRRQSYASSVDSGERRLDVSHIPPTRSLVGMWEQAENGAMKGGRSGDGGNEIVNRQEGPRRRPASSHESIPGSKPAVLTRPVSSHAPMPEQMISTRKPPVQPRPSSSQAPSTGQIVFTSKPPVQPRPVSSHTPGSKAVEPSSKPPAQNPVVHNPRPNSSHAPLPNPSTKPPMQPLSQRDSMYAHPPTKPSTKPTIQSVRPTPSHALEPTESSSKLSVQKPSVPPPRRSSTHIPAPENQSTNPPIQAPRPLSMQSNALNSTDSTDSPSKSLTQPPRRASTIKTPPRPPRPTPTCKHPVSKSLYNNDDDDDGSSDDSFVSASSQPKPQSPSWRAKLAQQNRRQSSSNLPMNVNSLADAIVAGSLASSRASSPPISSVTIRPPPPPTRRHKNISLFHSDTSRTPTPPHTAGPGNTQGATMLKTTMRKPKTKKELKEEEGEGHKRRAKKHLVKTHPNKHHEGDRKRWRDVITEKERKRYEAVWASNKGLFPYTVNGRGEMVDVEGAGDTVPGVVVKDLWDRSRLPGDVLEEVWGLVDRRGAGAGNTNANVRAGGGRLDKEEFVVGLWLIDQRLKGRKLPGRVGKSVWGSAVGVGGIKIRDLGS